MVPQTRMTTSLPNDHDSVGHGSVQPLGPSAFISLRAWRLEPCRKIGFNKVACRLEAIRIRLEAIESL